mgnify:CR=1 FL=1
MKKRLLSVLLLLCMLLTLLPTAAFAEEAHEHAYEEAFACICAVECTEEYRNADCPVCGAEDARPEDCALYTGQMEEHALEEEKLPEEADASVDADGQHVHCFCGGSVLAGDHTSHSDVTFTAWNGTSGIPYTNNTAYVYLTGNATLNSDLIVDGKTLYLCLNGKTLASNGEKKLKVRNNARLVLCDCAGGGTIKGATKNVWGGACVYLYTSRMDMFGGKLTGGKVTKGGGGGAIALDDQQCVFSMYGGEISGNNGNNYGGAIFRKFDANKPNTTGGTFNMYGGVIKNNTAKNGGAFFSTTGGTVNLEGGTISGNKATMNSKDAGGGAIYMRGCGTITISGSTEISGNSSSLDGGAILMGWGTITISGSARLTGNTASRWGGAICLRKDSNQQTTLNMTGGTLSGNKANSEGGAVHVTDANCTFNLSGGKLTGNTSGDGGAVYLNQEPSILNMTGGEISGNTATGSGGGVYIYRSGSVCDLSNGTISGNTAVGNGGGIYVNPSNNGQLKLGGAPVVTGNTVAGKANNVYLPSGKTLTISAAMSSGASVGVTTANTSYPVAFSNAYAADYTDCFTSDDANAHVEYGDDQKLYLVSGPSTKEYSVAVVTVGNGTASASPASAPEGAEITLTAVPAGDSHFKNWQTEHPDVVLNGSSFVMPASNVTITAIFELHDFTAENAEAKYLKSGATCTEKAVYYKSCAACGLSSAGTASEATFEAGNVLGHDWGAWTSNGNGTHTRVCKRDSSHAETDNCSGGTATCTARAVCVVCGGEYGELLPHHFTAEIAEAKYLKSGSTCTEKAVYYKSCAACGLSSAGTAFEATFEAGNVLGHDWGAWTSNGNDTHTRVCKRDSSHTETDSCSGGTATCTARAVCTVCGGEYGALLAHDFTAEIAEAKYLKSGATCTEKAVYYKSCAACGLSSAGTAFEATFEAGNVLGHDWGTWTSNGNDTHTRVCKRDSSHTETGSCSGGAATCTARAVCAVCGGEYGALAPNNHTGTIYWITTETTHEGRYTCCEAVAVPMEPHAFGEWVVIYQATAKVWGIVEHTCTICGYQERVNVAPLDGAAAYALKFETNGGSRISDVYAPYDMKIDLSKYEPVKDGYRFTGWYLDRMLTEEVTSVRMTKNVTVYAGWRRTELPFNDVRGDDWFYDDVAYVYENGLMNGTSETTFSPYISTTRGMIVTILYRMEGKPAVLEACPFTDVKAGAYYERAIVWAAENGIVKGYGNGCFGPDDQITREQMAAILYRYAKYRGLDVSVGENTNILSYDDALDISEYAVSAMQWACGAQIIQGADGRLTPGAKATRAQVAAILRRFCENVLKP